MGDITLPCMSTQTLIINGFSSPVNSQRAAEKCCWKLYPLLTQTPILIFECISLIDVWAAQIKKVLKETMRRQLQAKRELLRGGMDR